MPESPGLPEQQLALAGMPTRLFTCTPSRLTTWLDCPRRYRMTYLDRPAPSRGPAFAHTSVGAVVHLALARLWDLPADRRTPSGARALVDAAWQPDGFADDAQAERSRTVAGEMVERYVADLDTATQPAGIERTAAFRTATLAVSGRVDRVDRRGDEVVVVDYKTGRTPSSQTEARGSLALALYAMACARTFRTPCTTVELHHLPSGVVASHEHTPESLSRHLGRAEALAAEAGAATAALTAGGDQEELFPPRPSTACGWCDVARHCPQGMAASGGPQRSWAGLAEDRGPYSP